MGAHLQSSLTDFLRQLLDREVRAAAAATAASRLVSLGGDGDAWRYDAGRRELVERDHMTGRLASLLEAINAPISL